MIGEDRSKHSKFDRRPYPFMKIPLVGTMKNILLSTCMVAALMAADGAPSLAGDLSRARQDTLELADDCQTYCRANATTCRAQCAEPEEQEQCIVNCGKSDCIAGCDKFERSCNEHCQSSKG
jgi:hypothetical protein